MTTETNPLFPLFYRAPELLSPPIHGRWRLRDGDAAFAQGTPFIPIVVGEMAAACASYPIIFGAEESQPVVVTGIEQSNLFVADGRWSEDAYVPAYVRRYPFGFIATTNPDGFALAIDGASDRIVRKGEEGVPLFDGDAPSDLTKQALAFCDVFQGEAAATRAFSEALRAQDLLIDQRADVTLPDGGHRGIEGFQVVDTEKLAQLPDDVVLDWHRRGWLALVHFHLASLQRFPALLARRAGQQKVAPLSQKDGSEAQPVSDGSLVSEEV